MEKLEGKRQLVRHALRWMCDVRVWTGMIWLIIRQVAGTKHGNGPSSSIKCGESLH